MALGTGPVASLRRDEGAKMEGAVGASTTDRPCRPGKFDEGMISVNGPYALSCVMSSVLCVN